MSISSLRKVVYWSALVVTVFNALSAVGGGIAVLVSGGTGMGMPLSMLHGLFPNYTAPGVILLVVIGGTQVAATALLVARREAALLWTAVAGVSMLIWILVETGIIAGTSWAQLLYFGTGMVQVVAVLALLGVVAWLPRAALASASAPPPSGLVK